MYAGLCHLDLKEVPQPRGRTRSRPTKDMASFAIIDGGTLIVGIAEDKDNRVFTLAPQPLKGLAEKTEQIARSIPDPPGGSCNGCTWLGQRRRPAPERHHPKDRVDLRTPPRAT